ncbi:hypothetical protein [Nitrosomonas ureae]|uniref:Uncharacterized protein n=1 Tax=Nitrosomonas ureae TaxID=44577 RepID=A0A2T5I9X6_9PROT|nr:hypothetical protein [Nitrosomonas ureae]PTQ80620.1 hypothetical protein C8R28_103734 [Nitrosomonas ureae]
MTKQRMFIFVLILTFSTVFPVSAVFAHGKVTLESDICVKNIAGSMVHLSTYQPQHDPEAEYCTEIPKEGEILWVLDLVDQALRDMPIAIQLVRGSEKNNSKTISSFYSRNHSDGVIKGEFNLDEGNYTMFITGEGVPPLLYEFPLKIQKVNYVAAFSTAVPYLLTFLLLAFLSNKLLKRKKAR